MNHFWESDRLPQRPSSGRIVFGALLLLGGLAWLLDAADVIDISAIQFLPVALIIIGIALVAGAGRGLNVLLIIAGAWISIILISSGDPSASVDGIASVSFGQTESQKSDLGSRIETPKTISEVSDKYEQSLGRLVLDLTRLDLPEGTTTVSAEVGVGQLVVYVPEGVEVHVNSFARNGTVKVLRQEVSGHNVSQSITIDRASSQSFEASSPGSNEPDTTSLSRQLFLDLKINVGLVEVRHGAP